MYLSINNKPTALQIKTAGTPFKRLTGWMAEKTAPENGLLIFPCGGIHTFFMRFAIDALFLDGDNTVLRVVSGLAPWRMIPFVGGAKSVLELAAGQAEGLKIKKGDVLQFIGS